MYQLVTIVLIALCIGFADGKHRRDRSSTLIQKRTCRPWSRSRKIMGRFVCASIVCGAVWGGVFARVSTTGSCMSVDFASGLSPLMQVVLGGTVGIVLGSFYGVLLAPIVLGGDFTLRAVGRHLETWRASRPTDAPADTLLRPGAPDLTKDLLISSIVPDKDTSALMRIAQDEWEE